MGSFGIKSFKIAPTNPENKGNSKEVVKQ